MPLRVHGTGRVPEPRREVTTMAKKSKREEGKRDVKKDKEKER
jgi:hypothetical protein